MSELRSEAEVRRSAMENSTADKLIALIEQARAEDYARGYEAGLIAGRAQAVIAPATTD